MPLGNKLKIKRKSDRLQSKPEWRLPAGRQGIGIINMYYVYAIRSKNHTYNYIGITDNPERRISEHNHGYCKTTKPFRPFKNILIEKYKNRIEARKREKFLKSGYGKEYIKSI